MLALNLEEILDEQVTVDESFTVDTLDKAVWLDEKIHDREMEMKNVDRIAESKIAEYQAKIDRIKQWQEDQKAAPLSFIEWARGKMFLFLNQNIQEQIDQKKKKITKSIKLPFRQIKLSVQSPELIAGDVKVDQKNKKLIEWAEANCPELIKVEKAVDWAELKKKLNITDKVVTEDGEMLDFIKVTVKPDKFDWKVVE